MSYENAILLEVKEKNALGTDTKPGDFQVLLAQPVEIEDGDEISIKSVFIDNQESGEQRIIIEEDIYLILEYGVYMRNVDLGTSKKFFNLGFELDEGTISYFWGANSAATDIPADPSPNGYNNTVPNTDPPIQTIPVDYSAYIPCIYNSTHNANNTHIAITVTLQRATPPNPDGNIIGKGTGMFFIDYTDETGAKKEYQFTDTFDGYTSGTTANVFSKTVSIQLLMKDTFTPQVFLTFDGGAKSIVPTSAPLTSPNGVSATIQFNAPGTSYQPLMFNTRVNIPKNAYTPSDLCDLINRNMTEYTTIDNATVEQGSIRVSYQTLRSTNAIAAISDEIQYVREDGGVVFTISGDPTVTPQYFVGSNQFALNFDDILNRFQFQFIHFPMYDTNGNLINMITQTSGVTPNFRSGDGNTPITVTAGDTGGIFFNNLTAFKTGDDTAYDFWSSKLGFSQMNNGLSNDLILKCFHNNGKNSGHLQDTYPTFSLKNGINVTSARKDIDNFILKGNTYESLLGPNILQLQGLAAKPILSSEQSSSSIDAANSVFNTLIDEGYYQIEIQAGGLNSKVVGANDVKTKISSIVNRYFSENSYTSDAGAGSISYIHSGTSFNLTDFKVRVLNSENELATNIGTDNTIFIQVLKQKKNLNQIKK